MKRGAMKLISLGLTGEMKTLKSYRKLCWIQNYSIASSIMSDSGKLRKVLTFNLPIWLVCVCSICTPSRKRIIANSEGDRGPNRMHEAKLRFPERGRVQTKQPSIIYIDKRVDAWMYSFWSNTILQWEKLFFLICLLQLSTGTQAVLNVSTACHWCM